jgi:HTH-type transcriptional regulator, transcriptional repressor of NAD biosynthesis genes
MEQSRTTGLVLGKFMPVHTGHLALLRFAAAQVDELLVLVCANTTEPIPGELRLQWMKESLREIPNAKAVYCDDELPDAPYSSRDVSAVWASYLKNRFPQLTHIFGSEEYVAFVAEYAGLQYAVFDEARKTVPVAATLIRENPVKYWNFIAPAAQPYFVRKIAIVGAESTGKTTLAENLAAHYKTVFVTEAARRIVHTTATCTWNDLFTVASTHAADIMHALPQASRFLVVDTEMCTTQVFGQYLFGRMPEFDETVIAANHFHDYIFLEADIPFVQDGTRLEDDDRQQMNVLLKNHLTNKGIDFQAFTGTADEKRAAVIAFLDKKYGWIPGEK